MNILLKLFCCPCILCFHAIRIFYCGCISLWLSAFAHCIQASCCGCLSVVCCCFGCKAHWWDKDFPACALSIDELSKSDDEPRGNRSSAEGRELPNLKTAGDRDHRANHALARYRRQNRRYRAAAAASRNGPPSDSDFGDDDDPSGVPWVRLETLIIDEAQRDHAGDVVRGKKQKSGELVAENGINSPVLFADGILPEDIVQGGLGDCWLLCSISALAEFPALVRGLFKTKRYNPYGKYTLTLFDIYSSSFVDVEVDTRVPCAGTRREVKEARELRKKAKSAAHMAPIATPRYTGPSGGEMWVPILEKAVAKLLGSYQELEGGRTSKGLKILTGYPVVEFERVLPSDSRDPTQFTANRQTQHSGWERQINSDQCSVVSPQSLFYLIRDFDHRKAIMTCTIFQNARSKHTSHGGTLPLNGLVEGHAYTLLSAAEVGEFKLLKIRNPWGSAGEWQGDWGDKSSKWRDHPDVRNKIQKKFGNNSAVTTNADGVKPATEMKSVAARKAGGLFVDNTGRVGEETADGVFWMAIEDFDRVFNNVTVAVRDVGFSDMEIDPHEEIGPCCGPLVGCCGGCGRYWCCCEGCKALCCDMEGTTEVAGRRK